MLHLIPPPLHRLLYRVAYRVRARWRKLSKWPSRGVAVIGRDAAGRVLLVRHAYGTRRWALPGGGRGKREDPIECARREIREELGCGLSDIELVEVVERTIQGSPNTAHIFTARIQGEPRPDGREIVEVGWFALAALPPEMVALSRLQLERFGRG